MDTLTIIKPDDWHLHLREGQMLEAVLPDTVKSFRRAIVMPNLIPPVTTTDIDAGTSFLNLNVVPEGQASCVIMRAA